ncbi:hypothetical protein BCR33DRAFT_727648 [Rhizoclosmatium globosum]|uniref:Uncharacterized protein n=1 Tax=Rhizoclosmatium globosum TaxID=329046 RepID=A0A1Y2AQG2_9FUNG|nr:hypothetical protein BCR33DRAFT_727644 [Rhizoclosmatium globosum]ORY24185.1 hypothetical protein BCR33DRAFT_727648 [Rhizoclosmatium globosum]|eukprot:ORY24182.1 hypothetical protein BCR33DRAFT_727644 [Rhizoclosmatium globosum]
MMVDQTACSHIRSSQAVVLIVAEVLKQLQFTSTFAYLAYVVLRGSNSWNPSNWVVIDVFDMHDAFWKSSN